MQAAGCIGVPSDLSALAEMGSCGQHSNSMHRDLVALVKDDSQLPQPFFGVSPLQEAACGTSNHVAPLGFSCLVGKLQTILGNSFFLPGGKDALLSFWKHFASHLCMAGFRGINEQWQACTLPLFMHGDAVPTIGCGKVWAKLLQAYSWGCLLARGTTKKRSLYLWGAFEQNLKHGGEGTLKHFFLVLKWSFTALQTGKFPSHDWRGRKFAEGSQEHALAGFFLAGGFCGHLVSIQGDLEWHASALDLPRWNLKAGGCSVCKGADEGEQTWKVLLILMVYKAMIQTLLHTDPFTHRNFYTQKLLHTEAFTHKHFHTQRPDTETSTHRSFYTQTLSHTETGPVKSQFYCSF